MRDNYEYDYDIGGDGILWKLRRWNILDRKRWRIVLKGEKEDYEI